MNILDYHNLKTMASSYFEIQEKPNFIEPLPGNRSLNILLNIDNKGVSKLYKKVNSSKENILLEICERWEEKTGLILESHNVSRSFLLHNRLLDDTYLKYIHFRSIHRKNFTNNFLYKIGTVEHEISVCVYI